MVWRANHPATGPGLDRYKELLGQDLTAPMKMELFVANADGSGSKQITNFGCASFAPQFTPDGKRIIFASNKNKCDSREFELFLIDIDGENLEQVTSFGGFTRSRTSLPTASGSCSLPAMRRSRHTSSISSSRTGSNALATRFECHRRCHLFAVANELDRNHIADLAVSQSIREVVQVIDRLVAKSDQDVPAFSPAFAAGDPARTSENFTPFSTGAKSGIEPKYGPYPPPPPPDGGAPPCGPLGCTFTNFGRASVATRFVRDVVNKTDYLRRRRTADFVPRVARLVIVAVEPGEEEQNRNRFRGKRCVIARAEPVLGKVDLEIVIAP